MAHSYSGLKDFEGCPRRYHEVKILKKYKRVQTEQTIWGEKVHEEAEKHIRDKKPFEIEFPGSDVVEALNKLDGEKFCEMEIAVNDKLEPIPFKDPKALVRGIADLVIKKEDKIRVVDYKTGSAKYPDTSQLELMSLLLLAHFSDVQKCHGALVFLAHNTIVQNITKREDAQRLWQNWMAKINRLEAAHDSGVWNAKPSGLCGWCPVDTCEHWKPRRK